MTTKLSNLQRKCLNHVWHPCSQMPDHEYFPLHRDQKAGKGFICMMKMEKQYMDAVSLGG